MTDPGYTAAPQSVILDEAVAELRKARDANEARLGTANSMDSGQDARKRVILAEINDRRMALGQAFLAAAAIERGLPPCCHHAQPDPEPQS
jgi:hypothetical protein